MIIKNIQIKFWYEYVRNEVKKQNIANKNISAYQLEDMELSKYKRNRRIKDQLSNRWYRYKHGTNMPRAYFIEQVDKKVEGSASIINNPMWKILKILESKSSEDHFNELKKIDLLCFNKKTRKTISKNLTELKPYTNGIGRILAYRGSFESIAALILFIFQIKQQIIATKKIILNSKFNSKNHQIKKRLKEQLGRVIYYIHHTMLLIGMEYLDHPAFKLLEETYDFIFHHLLRNIPVTKDMFFSYKNIKNFTSYLLLIEDINILYLMKNNQSPLSRYNCILSHLFQFNISYTSMFLIEKKPFS